MVDFQSRDSRSGSLTGDSTEAADGTEPPDRTADDSEDAPSEAAAGLVVLTVETDETATVATADVVSILEADGHTVVASEEVEATEDAVQAMVDRLAGRRDVEAIVTVGGTGVGNADVTVEAVEPLLETRLPGFAELFRISYHERVGTDVIGMRPIAGIIEGVPVYCLPGDSDAATFAAEDLVLGSVDDLIATAAE